MPAVADEAIAEHGRLPPDQRQAEEIRLIELSLGDRRCTGLWRCVGHERGGAEGFENKEHQIVEGLIAALVLHIEPYTAAGRVGMIPGLLRPACFQPPTDIARTMAELLSQIRLMAASRRAMMPPAYGSSSSERCNLGFAIERSRGVSRAVSHPCA